MTEESVPSAATSSPAASELPPGTPGMGALAVRLGIELVEARPDRVVGTMPVTGNTQPYGLLHGGASLALAEQLGSVAAALHAGPERMALGIEVSATHHRAATCGTVTGVATPAHRGGTLATYDVVISDDRGRRLCTARITCLLRDQAPRAAPGRA